MKKIYCIEMNKIYAENIPTAELRKSIGWVEPVEIDGEQRWRVTMIEGHYDAKNHADAIIIANSEMANAMLVNLLGVGVR